MVKQFNHLSIITDAQAEGSPEHHEDDGARSKRQPPMTRSMQSDARRAHLAGETGMMPAVVADAESADDNTEAQDASRTTAETTAAPEHQPKAAPAAQTERQPRILIVEDTVELAEVIQATLQRLNMNAVVEMRGERALKRYETLQPDVVLLDIALPDTSGWKLLETIREQQAANTGVKQAAIIVITAYGDAANRLVGKLQNVHSYLVKPFTADEVAKKVLKALNSNVG